MTRGDRWREVYDGGSVEAEREIILSLANELLGVQEINRHKAGLTHPSRTLHAKIVAGVTNATLSIEPSLPPEFAVGHFQAGVSLDATVRFSNASGVAQADSAPDMRGAAIRLRLPGDAVHDLLMTSFPVSHARNARQFVEFAVIASGDRATLSSRLVEKFGVEEAQRMANNIRGGVRPCSSFALENFWSRGAILWGENPVRFQLRAVREAAPAQPPASADSDALRTELAGRLLVAPVRFHLALQPFVDEERTPIEDGAVEWTEEVSRPIVIATLSIPQQDILSEPGQSQASLVDAMAFNPWNAPAEFRPLGNLNRARGVVYQKSAERWGRG